MLYALWGGFYENEVFRIYFPFNIQLVLRFYEVFFCNFPLQSLARDVEQRRCSCVWVLLENETSSITDQQREDNLFAENKGCSRGFSLLVDFVYF